MKTIATFTSIALLSISCTKQKTVGAQAPGEAPTATQIQAPTPYPIDTCLVSGEKLGTMGEPVVMVHQGREIKFCCDSCLPKFKKDPAKFLAELDAAFGE